MDRISQSYNPHNPLCIIPSWPNGIIESDTNPMRKGKCGEERIVMKPNNK